MKADRQQTTPKSDVAPVFRVSRKPTFNPQAKQSSKGLELSTGQVLGLTLPGETVSAGHYSRPPIDLK